MQQYRLSKHRDVNRIGQPVSDQPAYFLWHLAQSRAENVLLPLWHMPQVWPCSISDMTILVWPFLTTNG